MLGQPVGVGSPRRRLVRFFEQGTPERRLQPLASEQHVAELLAQRDLLATRSNAAGLNAADSSVRFLATDGRERFARVAAYFLERSIAPEAVELIDPAFAVTSTQPSG
jgi:hypothetical protein